MKSFVRYLLVCCLFMLNVALAADEQAIPDLSQRVTDLTGTLTNEQRTNLENKIAQFEQAKGSQIAVLVINTTQPEAIEQYSIRVAEKWKIGRKKTDDGVIILLAMQDRKVRIEVGYGLEGAIPDAYAKRIIAEDMTPLFKKGDYYGGLDAGVDKLCLLISGENLPPPSAKSPESQMSLENWLVFFLVGCVFVGRLLSAFLGRTLGSLVTGGFFAFITWAVAGAIGTAIFVGFLAFVFTLLSPGFFNPLAFYGGSGRGGFGGGGGFSGGGGTFGGGGASGGW